MARDWLELDTTLLPTQPPPLIHLSRITAAHNPVERSAKVCYVDLARFVLAEGDEVTPGFQQGFARPRAAFTLRRAPQVAAREVAEEVHPSQTRHGLTSVTVADTTFNRRSQDLVIRRIHATEQPDYVLTITGDYRVMAVAHLDMRVIGFQTGELFAHAAAVSSVANTRYSAMEQALREMFGRGKG